MVWSMVGIITDLQGVQYGDKNVTITVNENEMVCEIKANDEASCEKCIDKGMNCYWCESSQKCFIYRWNFPNCPLEYVRKNNCWVNWLIVYVLALAFFVLCLTTVCCCLIHIYVLFINCCGKLEQAGKIKRFKKVANTWIGMQRKQQQRIERQAQCDYIRQKYGLC